MYYLDEEDILLIHSFIIDSIGGSHGVRDHHGLASLAGTPQQKVFGQELYASLFDKAAVYARNIIMGHIFVDGNKRTGITAASVFLERNAYCLVVAKGKVEEFALRIVSDRLEVLEIAQWFEENCQKI